MESYSIYFCGGPHSTAYAILVPWPGIEPAPSALEAQNLNYWATREVPIIMVFFYISLYIGEGNGNPLQYSCLENSMDRGAWQGMVHGLQRAGHDWTTNTHTHTHTQFLLIYLFLAVLSLHCCIDFSLVAVSGGQGRSQPTLVAVCGLLIAVASLVMERGL